MARTVRKMQVRWWLIIIIAVLLIFSGLFFYSKNYINGALFLTIGVLLLFFYAPIYGTQMIELSTAVTDLSQLATLADTKALSPFFKNPSASLQAFVYLNPMTKTGKVRTCGTGNTNCPPIDNPCQCTSASDCTSCIDPTFNTIFKVTDFLSLQVVSAPDASRPQQAATQLIVYTKNAAASQAKVYLETLTLPPFPFQQWTLVTINMEGRRVDVFYDREMVKSQILMYMPMTTGPTVATATLQSGSPNITGLIATPKLYTARLTTQEVAANYSKYADTRGRPYVTASAGNMGAGLTDPTGIYPTVWTNITPGVNFLAAIDWCATGNCIKAPTMPPSNTMYTWSNRYA